jgi:6-phosphogluconolactonase
MKGELEPARAAEDYEAEMAQILPDRPFPRIDFNLLGMGEDGHTASLFPGTAGLDENKRWVVAHRVERLNTDRITLTFPVLNHARRTVAMIAGASKADVIAGVFSGVERYPIERVRPVDGEMIWLLDAAAAEKLPPAVRSGATYI